MFFLVNQNLAELLHNKTLDSKRESLSKCSSFFLTKKTVGSQTESLSLFGRVLLS